MSDEIKELRRRLINELYKNTEYAFDTVWSDSFIPDAGNSAILKAMDIVHPNEEDSDTVLEAKLYLIWSIANTLPDLEDTSIKEVKQCLDDNERLLSAQHAKESYQICEKEEVTDDE